MLATEGSTGHRLLQTVVENATWKCGVWQTRLFEPFEILRQSNHESSGNEKENSTCARRHASRCRLRFETPPGRPHHPPSTAAYKANPPKLASRGSLLVAYVVAGHAAYRTQLFCYLKTNGRDELNTMNLWAGIDGSM